MWKFLLLVFRKSGRRNYAKEAALLLLQYHFFFSERKAAQLNHSLFINTKGKIGCNMPCDMFMKHLNHRLKGVIRHMGSNIQHHSLVRAAIITLKIIHLHVHVLYMSYCIWDFGYHFLSLV